MPASAHVEWGTSSELTVLGICRKLTHRVFSWKALLLVSEHLNISWRMKWSIHTASTRKDGSQDEEVKWVLFATQDSTK